MNLRLRALPSLIRWGVRFLRNSNARAFQNNTLRNLKLALYSRDVMQQLRADTGIGADHNRKGTLRIFRDRATWDAACSTAEHLSAHGLAFHTLSPDAVVELEPALGSVRQHLTGGIHYEADQSGDAHQFCVVLAEQSRKEGVQFRFGVEVSALQLSSGRVDAVVAADERYVADRYVIAAGSYSAPLLRGTGVTVPVRPVKGYSVTLNECRAKTPLRIPIVDDQLHAAVVPLGSRIRVGRDG
jgi:D-amino-acid dehydrogenase